MNKEDSIEKKANRIWIVSFIIAGLCFLYGVLFESTTMIAEFIFLFTGFFGIAIFVQTKKPMIAKIIIISIVGLFFLVIGAIENILMGVVLSSVTVIPLLIILEISNMKSSKEKSLVTVTVLAVILLIVIILSVCSMVADRHTSSVSGGYYEETTVRQYNAGFVEYEGQTNVKGANIKALIRDVMTHNKSTGSDTTLLIMVEYGTELPDEFFTIPDNSTVDTVNKNAKNVLGLIENGKTYKVTCQYDNRTGYVTKIAVYQTN